MRRTTKGKGREGEVINGRGKERIRDSEREEREEELGEEEEEGEK